MGLAASTVMEKITTLEFKSKFTEYIQYSRTFGGNFLNESIKNKDSMPLFCISHYWTRHILLTVQEVFPIQISLIT